MGPRKFRHEQQFGDGKLVFRQEISNSHLIDTFLRNIMYFNVLEMTNYGGNSRYLCQFMGTLNDHEPE